MTKLTNPYGTPPIYVTDDQFITALEYIGDDVESFAELLDMKVRWEFCSLSRSHGGEDFDRALYSAHKVMQNIVRICIEQGYVKGEML